MLLSELVIEENIIGKNQQINNITHLSNEVNEKTIFVSLVDDKEAALRNIKLAINKGAKVILSTFYLDSKVTCVIVDDVRFEYALISSKIYNFKNNKAKIIGVVGTNGKTSTVKMLYQILSLNSKKVGYITTHKAYFNNKEYPTNMTTPDPPLLFSLIEKMNENNVEYIVMEVSAHAIFYKKISPINFDYLILSNVSQDHLDFFTDFYEYKNTKKSIFVENKVKNIIVNSDDLLGQEILKEKKAFSYGLNNPADIFAINIKEEKNATKFILNAHDNVKIVNLKAVGLFNVYNFLSCIQVCLNEKISINKIVEYANLLQPIPGRIEYLGKKRGDIYLDYAHTPKGLENLLLTLRKTCKNNLYCLFGCGGNRDATKRKIMGKVAGKLADFTIITSDNPRFEEPYEIIKQIENGIKTLTSKYIVIQDRSLAIKYAIENLNLGDVLVVAGKGDEEYQEIMGVKHYFSDRKLIKSIID